MLMLIVKMTNDISNGDIMTLTVIITIIVFIITGKRTIILIDNDGNKNKKNTTNDQNNINNNKNNHQRKALEKNRLSYSSITVFFYMILPTKDEKINK